MKSNPIGGRIFLWCLVLAAGSISARAAEPVRFSDREVRTVVDRVQRRADEFRKHLDASLDRSALQGSRREDNVNVYVREFAAATGRLRDHLGDGRQSGTDVEEVLTRASVIDRFMRDNRLDERSEADWALLSADLSTLGRMYDVRWGRNRWEGHPADAAIARLLAHLSRRTDDLQRGLPDALEQSRLTDTRREKEIDRDLRQFVAAAERLQTRFDAQKVNKDDVRQLFRRAQPVDRFIRRYLPEGRAERIWNDVRDDLDRLGTVYDVRLEWSA